MEVVIRADSEKDRLQKYHALSTLIMQTGDDEYFLATNPITPITAILVVFPNQKESAELLIGLGSPLLFLVQILMDMGNTKRLICFQIQQQYLQMGRSAIPFLLACLKRTLLK
ncbi:hypothetical protein ABES23_13910 [Peribacillus frigoritolerans]|uniref:hypothetical protein n=1 Tax=Peribacillus frigoritolerans TaxID=450367 RepID=UPI003D2AE215